MSANLCVVCFCCCFFKCQNKHEYFQAKTYYFIFLFACQTCEKQQTLTSDLSLGVYISQSINYARDYSQYTDFVNMGVLLAQILFQQSYEEL